MGKSSPSAPAAPDPAETARAQGAINKETAITQASLNRINQITPNGTLTYSKNQSAADQHAQALKDYYAGSNKQFAETGQGYSSAVPKIEDFTDSYTQTTTLSPEQKKLYDLTNQASQKTGTFANQQLDALSKSLSTPVDYSGAPALTSSIDPNSPAYKAALEAQMARINPQLDKNRAALENKLATQGITYGQEAYNNAQTPLNQQENDARTQAALTAFQTALQNAQLGNTARGQSISETTAKRNAPLNEISALLSGSQVQNPSFPTYAQTSVSPNNAYTDATNLKYQGALSNFNNQMSSNNAAKGALGGTAGTIGSALVMSDKRVKKDIKRIGMWGKYPAYSFRYLGSNSLQHGVMAQDVIKINPEAVKEINGILHVNYGAL